MKAVGPCDQDALRSAAAQVKAAGGDTLVLQMKPASGALSWKSGVELAVEIGASGTEELADVIRELRDDGIRFAAAVSCCADTKLAQAKSDLALMTAGSAYADGSGYWVNPANDAVRQYIAALCKELAEMGFAKFLRRSLHGTKLSIICSVDSAAYDRASQTGQDLSLLPRVFDRMCFFTDAATLTLLQEKLTAAYPDLDTQLRVVPFVPAKRDAGCWIVTT